MIESPVAVRDDGGPHRCGRASAVGRPSMVELRDGSVIAQLGVPTCGADSIRVLVSDRWDGAPRRWTLRGWGHRNLARPIRAFRCLRLATTPSLGGAAAIHLNAANEVAVEAFWRAAALHGHPSTIETVMNEGVRAEPPGRCPAGGRMAAGGQASAVTILSKVTRDYHPGVSVRPRRADFRARARPLLVAVPTACACCAFRSLDRSSSSSRAAARIQHRADSSAASGSRRRDGQTSAPAPRRVSLEEQVGPVSGVLAGP